MALRIADTIFVPTQLGEYQIQLCYGDITKVEEKVDIVMVSAFPGDYAAVGGTLIGALKRNLDIQVDKLARDKFMDLRTHFSCWISKELDPKVPYKRLICFERSRSKGDIIEQMRDMFRAFVPACGSQETTVITPLLGTGNQGHSESKVLSCIVDAAGSWMQAGLPLKCIKLVIYGDDDSNLNKLFSSMKEKLSTKFEKKLKADQQLSYDIFLTYEEKDKDWMNMICNVLLKKDKGLKIYTELKKFDQKKIWQDQIFKIMACSKKIIAVLTPSYVDNKDCLDQFNMAMCCNRLKKSEILYPFLLVSVESMPVYMKLVQYFDCRVRKKGEEVDIKVNQACSLLMNPSSENPDKDDDVMTEERFDYDVFISYSHKKPQEAEDLLVILSSGNSDLKIFFDRSELTMGSMWQSSLYESLDTSECIVALVCPSYFSSTVCQEEYNIALARYLKNPTEVLFIQVLIEPMETVPSHFSRIPMIDCTTSEKFDKSVHKLAKDITEWRYGRGTLPYVQMPVDKFSFGSMEEERKIYIKNNYSSSSKVKSLEPKCKLGELVNSSDGQVDVAISFARDAIAFAGVLNGELCSKNSKLNISFLNENMQGSLQDLDMAKQIIIIISKEFVLSHHHMQELHVALCRQRESTDKTVVRIVAAPGIPDKPMFLHLLPYETNMSDKIWRYIGGPQIQGISKAVMSYKEGMKGSFMVAYPNYYALQKTAYEVMFALTRSKTKDLPVPPIICNMLEAKLRANDYKQNTKVSEILIDISLDKNESKHIPFITFDDKEEEIEPILQESPQAREENEDSKVIPKTQTAIKWAEPENIEEIIQDKGKEQLEEEKPVYIEESIKDLGKEQFEGENNTLKKKAYEEMKQMKELNKLLEEEETKKKKSSTCVLL